jgi:hypothetical protein
MPFLKVYSPNFCPTFTECPQGRANQYLVGGGGVNSKIWAPFHSEPPPPQQKFSGKQKFFRKMLAGGGRGSTFCFRKQNVPKNFQTLIS